MKILITGTAGFIGYHLVQALIDSKHEVFGVDSVNEYYDPKLKFDRLAQQGIKTADIQYGKWIRSSKPTYSFIQAKLEDADLISRIFKEIRPDLVVNLAAQAGVRYSLDNPSAYTDSNITGFLHILEGCRHNGVKHLLYASSSSVYGLNESMPFSTSDNVDHPVSLYAATRRAMN